MKIAWYWYKNRQEDKWNQIEDLNINPHTYEHLIFYKEAKIIQWNKASSANGAGITGCQYVEDANRSISISMHKT